jgi:linoleoyl-CoA desaturase
MESALQIAHPELDPDEERLRAFGREIDRIRDEAMAKVGAEDVAYIKKVDAVSRAAEIVGRGLIHASITPLGFFAGVGALWLHKQLEATEIGHTALHGTFDKLEGAERFHSKTFTWQTPIDEESWRYVHNIRHHQYTNIAGRDPDIHFGPLRFNEHTPYDPKLHRNQMWHALLIVMNFGAGINIRDTGVGDHLQENGRGGYDVIDERTPESWQNSKKKLLRKWVPYYGKEFVLFPALAGPMFWKVALGNMLTELMRDVYSAVTIYCGHIGEDVADYPEGTKAGSRHRWYAMQVEATNNFEVPLPVSILCGALDRQIEHHLFPKLPTNRLREVAPRVRAACEKYGVTYKSDTWGNTLRKVVGRIRKLSRPTAAEAAA